LTIVAVGIDRAGKAGIDRFIAAMGARGRRARAAGSRDAGFLAVTPETVAAVWRRPTGADSLDTGFRAITPITVVAFHIRDTHAAGIDSFITAVGTGRWRARLAYATLTGFDAITPEAIVTVGIRCADMDKFTGMCVLVTDHVNRSLVFVQVLTVEVGAAAGGAQIGTQKLRRCHRVMRSTLVPKAQ
jgi:hypothetical protein